MNTNTRFDKPHTRRSFLDLMIALGSSVMAAAMTIPGLMYLWPAAKGGRLERVEVKGAKSLTVGQGATILVGSEAVVVVRTRSGFRALSAVCTHLGCLVKWDSLRREFLCPCHAAVFDENGQVVSGPPPAPLREFAVKEVEGRVYVSSS